MRKGWLEVRRKTAGFLAAVMAVQLAFTGSPIAAYGAEETFEEYQESKDKKLCYSTYKKTTDFSFNIKGNADRTVDNVNEKDLYQTTYNDRGYKVALRVDGKNLIDDYEESNYIEQANGVTAEYEKGISVQPRIQFVSDESYVKITHRIKNISDTTKTIDLGIHADVQIASNDEAPVEKTKTGVMMRDTLKGGSNAQFNLMSTNTYGVDSINNLWYGYYTYKTQYLWGKKDPYLGDSSGADTDSGLALSWLNRTLLPGESRDFTIMMSVGDSVDPPEVDVSKGIILNLPDVAQQSEVVIVKASVKDVLDRKYNIYYAFDNGEQNILKTNQGDSNMALENYTDAAITAQGTGEDIAAQEIEGYFPVPSEWEDGSIHEIQVWIQNEKNARSDVKKVYVVKKSTEDGKPALDEAKKYTLSYNLDGGTGGPANSEQTELTTVTFPSSRGISKANHTFEGWKLEGDDKVYEPGQTFTMPSKPTVITAQWKPKALIVVDNTPQQARYDGQGHAFTVKVASPSDAELSTNTPMTVQYSPHGTGSFSSNQPVEGGFYDVKIQRAEDAVYQSVDTTCEKGLYIQPVDSQLTLSSDKDTYTYGETMKFTVNIARAAAKGRSASTQPNEMDFFLGTASNATKLGTADVNGNEAVLEYETTDQVILPGKNQTIVAQYGGGSSLNAQFTTLEDITLERKTLDSAKTAEAEGREYDETAQVKVTSVTFNGLESGDEVYASAVGTLEAADVGTYESVDLTDIQLTGDDCGFYKAADSITGVSTNVEITQIPVATPSQCELRYEATDKTSYEVSIASRSNCEYSFNGRDFSEVNTTTGEIGDEITGYIRQIPDDNHVQGGIASSTIILPGYMAFIRNGEGTGIWAEGAEIDISAEETRDGLEFSKWRVDKGKVSIASASNAETTFKMPDSRVEITAIYRNEAGDVTATPSNAIKLTPEKITLEAGDEKQLCATASPSDAELVWNSSNEYVAQVDDEGLVTGKKPGHAVITVYNDLAYGICEVEVTKKKLSGALPDKLGQILDGLDECMGEAGQDEEERMDLIQEAVSDIRDLNFSSIHKKNQDFVEEVYDNILSLEELILDEFMHLLTLEIENKESSPVENVEALGMSLSATLDENENETLLLIVEEAETPEGLPSLVKRDAAAILNIYLERHLGDRINRIQPEVPLLLSMELPETINPEERIVVYHFKAGGVETVKSWVDGDRIFFTAASFSTYVIANTTSGAAGRSTEDRGEYTDAGRWILEERGWWYAFDNGTWPGNEWKKLKWNGRYYGFCFDEYGYMRTGWFLDKDGKWYHLNEAGEGVYGALTTGWYQDSKDHFWYYLDPATGEMLTGHQTIDGNAYYFEEAGSNQSGWNYDNTQSQWIYTESAETALGRWIQP